MAPESQSARVLVRTSADGVQLRRGQCLVTTAPASIRSAAATRGWQPHNHQASVLFRQPLMDAPLAEPAHDTSTPHVSDVERVAMLRDAKLRVLEQLRRRIVGQDDA